MADMMVTRCRIRRWRVALGAVFLLNTFDADSLNSSSIVDLDFEKVWTLETPTFVSGNDFLFYQRCYRIYSREPSM